ncbi:MAG TPA: PQQ-binding-like beta-propeller repeat protein [Vicinamibacterales bacterium]|nr:PQQ-binding-like beta-propeller repeat protein [Vicinamibacterales bacterium]
MTLTRPLRLRPGVILAIVLVIARYLVPLIAPDAEIAEMPLVVLAMLSGVLLAVAIVLWWLLFSRAPWVERLAAVVLMVGGVFVTRLLVHESIRGGHMGMMLVLYSVPVLALALVVWAVLTHGMPDAIRRTTMVAAIVLACVPFTLIRTAGVIGAGSELHWRWAPTPEERLLAATKAEPVAVAPPPPPAETAEPPAGHSPVEQPVTETPPAPKEDSPAPVRPAVLAAEWPGFRGANRDSVIRDVRINTDWTTSPPAEMWRKPIGPGWSSFAVRGDVFYTQEQRGEEELVSCYRLSTGEPVWRHGDPVRFYESNAGAGPRGTPTIDGDRVYAVGATGIVNALHARTGAKLWSRNAVADTGQTVPDWGIASSPLVLGDIVIVAVAGQLIAYDAATGQQRWVGEGGGSGYSSPHLLAIDGVSQVLLMRGARTISVAPADGTLLWDHTGGPPATSIVQPALTPEGDVLIAGGDAMGGTGMRRLALTHGPDRWHVEERWHTRGLKPYFNDFVVHKGYAYGFDGSILSSIDLGDGARKWKGGRYGAGQMLLLADQDLLLITSEDGELALVGATPDRFTEVARMPALNGKTWNHPVLVRDLLLVRNGEEMVAFKLSVVASPSESQ